MADDDLPPGYKFRPDTDQLLLYYLRPKLDGEDFPQNLVPFCDLYGKQEPWQIWDKYFQELAAKDQERTDLYFITQHQTKTPKGKRINRSVGKGTWKGEDGATEFRYGKRKRFRYENKNDSKHNGCWLMHEFELDASLLRNKRNAKDYVLCILRKKSPSVKNNSQDQEDDEMSCDGGDDQQDGDLPVPGSKFIEEETSTTNTTTQKTDEGSQKAAVESEVGHQDLQESDEHRMHAIMEIEEYIEKKIAGQAMEKIDHNDLPNSDEVRRWALDFAVHLVNQAKKNTDHRDSQRMSLEGWENYLM